VLRWRLTLGVVLVAALAGLCWLDAHAARPGVYLAPLAILFSILAVGEMLRMFRARGVEPVVWATYLGAVLPVAVSCSRIFGMPGPAGGAAAGLAWLALGLAAGLIIAFIAEMRRFDAPGKAIGNLAHAALAILYIGGLIGVLVSLRDLGLAPLVSMIAIVKLSDIGQFTFGKLYGRRKLAPRLSPGKTWEGTIGGIATATIMAAIVLPLVLRGHQEQIEPTFLTAASYALSLAVAGLLGDLAESLLKRDAGVKDSSDWLPGFGGVLDLLDSLLFAAPVAYAWWALGLMTP
jgi:phosphatidate cytidylyltransferase